MGRFKLKCLKCGREYGQQYRLTCENDDSFLRADYYEKKLKLRNQPGIGRFHSWLPIQEELTTDAGPITYKSEAFARELGLPNLYIGFSGYWPERVAFVKTCSFKELEAYLCRKYRPRSCPCFSFDRNGCLHSRSIFRNFKYMAARKTN